jgi:hypothetical protein
MASSAFARDIEPEESVSQISFEASSSRPVAGSLISSDTEFRSRFASNQDLSDKFLIIANDPVTLMRSASLLEIRTPFGL